MPIKKLAFSFEVPITALLSLIASGNADLRIDVLGDNKPPKQPRQLNGHAPKLLEPPKKDGRQQRNRATDESGQRLTAYNALLLALTGATNHTLSTDKMRAAVIEHGFAETTMNSQVGLMVENGHAKRVGRGEYQLTNKGLKEIAARARAQEKKKPPSNVEEVTAKAEPNHG